MRRKKGRSRYVVRTFISAHSYLFPDKGTTAGTRSPQIHTAITGATSGQSRSCQTAAGGMFHLYTTVPSLQESDKITCYCFNFSHTDRSSIMSSHPKQMRYVDERVSVAPCRAYHLSKCYVSSIALISCPL